MLPPSACITRTTSPSASDVASPYGTDTAGQSLGEVESTKSVSDVYAPVSGRVVQVNVDLTDAPNRLNDDPYGEGWICLLEPEDQSSLGGLLDAAAYRALTAE